MKGDERSWAGRIPLALALTIAMPRLFVPSASAYPVTGGAKVTIGDAIWSSQGCPTATASPQTIPKLTGLCDAITADASAGAYQVCGADHAWIPGESSIDVGKTGCEVDTIVVSPGHKQYRIYNPKRSGQVTVVARVSGQCYDCAPATWTATGIVEVDLEDRDDGCDSCGGPENSSLGSGIVGNNSVDFRLYLGLASPLEKAGFLWVKAEVPSADLARPVWLQLPFGRPNVEVLLGPDKAIKQIKTPQGLVNVAEKDSYEYRLEVFYAANVTPKVKGYYGTNAPPFVTWVVRNPDGAGGFNRLWIIEQRDETERQFTYSWQNHGWDLLKPDGQTMVSTWTIPDPSRFNITNYYRQISSGAQVLRKNRKTYEFIPTLNREVLKQEVEGEGASSRTNTYTYYSSAQANGGNANKLQRVDYPEGDWVYYKYDRLGRMVTEFSAHGNNPPPAAGSEPNPLVDHCKVTEFAYALNRADDGVDDSGDSINPWSVRKTIVKIPVQVGSAWELREVSRAYHLSNSDGWEETQQCPDPGSHWDAPGNLRTITVKYRTTDFKAGMLQSISRPDGTAILYDYELTASGFTSIEQSGQPDNWASPSAIVNGLKTVTVLDELGLMQSRTITAIHDSVDTGIVLAQETYNYRDESGNYLDPLRRSYDLTDLAGRKTQYRYSCCGLEHVTDPDGAATAFDYDVLKRQVASQIFRGGSNGVKTVNIPDSAGQVLATRRIGANGSVITLEQSQYDILGRVVRRTNALGGVTSYSNVIVNDRLRVTDTYPDSGTRIELYYRDGQLESVSGTAESPARYQYGAEQDGAGGPWREFTLETKLDVSGNPTAEWTKTYHDGAGRPYKTVYADATPGTESDNPYSQSYFNVNGQLTRQQDPDSVVTLYEYNGSGELEYMAIDVNPLDTQLDANLNYPIDRANDRITRTVRTVFASSAPENSWGVDILRTEIFTWPTLGQDMYVRVSTTDVTTSGLKTWRTLYKDAADPGSAITTRVETRIASEGNGWTRTVTETEPDNSTTVSVYQYGRLSSMTRYSPTGIRLGKTTYAYDAHGRQYTATDARNGGITYGYNNADQITSVTTPPPAEGQSAQTTTTYYDTSLRAWKIVQPDRTSVTNVYYATGLLKETYGSRTYPAGYSYDAQGRMQTMINWTTFSPGGTGVGARVTTWNYDPYRGFLSNKRYPDDSGPNYTYTAAGRLQSRAWARRGSGGQRIVTAYDYNSAGDIYAVTYSNDPAGTANLSYTYDRRGRRETITQGNSTTTLSYNDADQLLAEGYGGSAALSGFTVTNGYDGLLRRTNLVAQYSGTPLVQHSFSFDAASRLQTVSDGANSATYSYLANSPLVGPITFQQSGATKMTTTKQYDYLNRLLSISSSPSSSLPQSYAYAYNAANQRSRVKQNDSSYWVYQYDALGQVRSGKKYWPDGTPVSGQQFEYAFDDIGNRTETKTGGDAAGSVLRSAVYSVNALNQYASRTVPGAVDILGIANAGGTVTVNGQNTYRRNEYFHEALTIDNSAAAVWQSVTISASGATPQSGHVYLPKTPEDFDDPATPAVNEGYDADGNQLRDGRWAYTWDAENRLIAMESLPAVPDAAKMRLEFTYDYRGRRIEKKVFVWNNATLDYQLSTIRRYLYDGWNLIAILDSQSSILQSFLWGLDLSGQTSLLEGSGLQGVGGVGGLLAIKPAKGNPLFVAYDGNGNVTGLIDAATGTTTAHYEYGPFGELIRCSGTDSKDNPFRFSTKYQDDETDLFYYGYRSYNPSTGRWLSRDPLGEGVGMNIYGFVGNDSVDFCDVLGLQKGAEQLMNPQHPPSKEVVPGVTVRRLVGPGAHQWMYFEPGYHIGVNKGKDKGKWVDETSSRPRDYLENPANYYEWEVVKRNLGWMRSKTPCKCATIEQIQRCIGTSILYEFEHGTPRKFNIVCNNCRNNSERILKRCCAQKGRLLNNPDDTSFLHRFFRDWFKGPTVYLPMASGGN